MVKVILHDINSDDGESLQMYEDVESYAFKLGEKIVHIGTQWKVTEILHQLDEDEIIVRVVKEGRYRY